MGGFRFWKECFLSIPFAFMLYNEFPIRFHLTSSKALVPFIQSPSDQQPSDEASSPSSFFSALSAIRHSVGILGFTRPVYHYGDMVSYTNPYTNQKCIGRITAVPGDFVKVPKTAIEYRITIVPKNHYWVLADNTEEPINDSRLFGNLYVGLIDSVLFAVVYPFSSRKVLPMSEDWLQDEENHQLSEEIAYGNTPPSLHNLPITLNRPFPPWRM